jgi:hypothetical protein
LAHNVTTESGEINEAWDLKDDANSTYSGDSVKAEFTVTLPASGRSGAESGSFFRSDANPADTLRPDNTLGAVTVAYAYNDGTPQEDVDFVVQLSIVDQLLAPCNSTFCYLHPYTSYYNLMRWPLGAGNTGYLPNQAAAELLLENLSNDTTLPNPVIKNLVILGHNDPNGMGGETSPKITERGTAIRLHNYDFTYQYGESLPAQRYRFVFFGGCGSAKFHYWSRAFGIEDTITAKQLSWRPEAVQAFVGWDDIAFPPYSFVAYNPIAGEYQGKRSSLLDECNAYNLFFAMWQSGFTLEQCISYTEVNRPPPPVSFDDLSKWNFGPYQDWAAKEFHLAKGARLRVWGYCGITRTGFVAGYDNSSHLHK